MRLIILVLVIMAALAGYWMWQRPQSSESSNLKQAVKEFPDAAMKGAAALSNDIEDSKLGEKTKEAWDKTKQEVKETTAEIKEDFNDAKERDARENP